jgi:hypothetical protein
LAASILFVFIYAFSLRIAGTPSANRGHAAGNTCMKAGFTSNGGELLRKAGQFLVKESTPMRTYCVLTVLASGWLLVAGPTLMWADDLPAPYQTTLHKGLSYLVSQQNKDGHWQATGKAYPTAMTGICGMALLMEGSTVREGQYKDNLRRACDYLISKARPNGLIGDPNMPGESERYMYGHGFAILFLSCVYGEEGEGERRERLQAILTRGCQFTYEAQTSRGGWGYISAKESGYDEGSVTITQVQALRAARNAGIPVPSEAITKAQKYLKDSTNAEGGVIYSLSRGGGGDARPALTAAAIACGFSTGDYKSELIKKWFRFCQTRLSPLGDMRMGHDEYTNYYYAQAIYFIGDRGWKELFPNDPAEQAVTWSKYRKATFDQLVKTQRTDGSWGGVYAGEIFATAVYVSILQLDKAVLPIYQR